jgi:hypothetical protein
VADQLTDLFAILARCSTPKTGREWEEHIADMTRPMTEPQKEECNARQP